MSGTTSRVLFDRICDFEHVKSILIFCRRRDQYVHLEQHPKVKKVVDRFPDLLPLCLSEINKAMQAK
jgi:hypothetical protein